MNLAATAADPGGSIARVEFYQGATLLNSDTTAPYAFDWANVQAGSYTLTAKAIDNQGNATTSAPVAITVTAQTALYFIHADHLNTPRALVDAQGRTVWKWENADPFGNNAPDEDPDADTQRVEFNLRFPGPVLRQGDGALLQLLPGLRRFDREVCAERSDRSIRGD